MTVGRVKLMDEVEIARLCHEVNRAYCRAIGDDSQLPWEEAPEAIRNSAINGVRYAIKNPDATPEMQHEAWSEQKKAEGWVYGEVKDMEKKTHPCLVPYAELPQEQRIKDYLFQGIVRANV